MVSSGMLRRLALVRTGDSEQLSAFFIRLTRIGELGTTLAVTSNRRKLRRNTLMNQALSSYETSVLTRATRRNIAEDATLHPYFSIAHSCILRFEYLKVKYCGCVGTPRIMSVA
jgi:hypothetical protein